MPNNTTNYGLTKPLQTEQYDVDVFNDNADTIDTALKAAADTASSAQTTADGKVSKSGDTMTGRLTLPADPTVPMHAATKGYVDVADTIVGNNAIAALDLAGGKVSRAGDTMTGQLTLVGNPTAALHAATKGYVDSVAGGGGGGGTPDGGSNPNLLINGAFTFWQRGTSFTPAAANSYTADRWRTTAAVDVLIDSSSRPTEASSLYTMRVRGNTVLSTTIRQVIDYPILMGKQVTASFWAKTDSGATITLASAPGASAIQTNGAWQKFTYTYTSPNSMLDFACSLGASGNSVWLAEVKLELGGQATQFTLPLTGDEAARCYRYCYMSNGDGDYIRAAQCYADAIYFAYRLPVPMQALPTLAVANFAVTSISGAAQTGFTFSVGNTRSEPTRCLLIIATKTGHGLTDATLRVNYGTIFDAEA